MDKFTASNGHDVERYSGSLDVGGGEIWIQPWAVDALREFFQAERDEELGRWRWPENPDYVVYPRTNGDSVTAAYVVHLRTGHGMELDRSVRIPGEAFLYQRAARAYFEAHPERKPWADAKHGEVWLVGISDSPELPMTVEREMQHFPRFMEPISAMTYGPEAGITSARRIWPEEAP